MLKKLKHAVFDANQRLSRYGLVTFTWGNVSGINRKKGLVAIKPSGVDYDRMNVNDIVITDMDGNCMEGELRPSSDLMTHLVLYKTFPDIGGVAHTHSRWATIFAQMGRGIPALGTTHADTFYGEVPCTRRMTESEINGEYEKETGNVIAERFLNLDPAQIPGVLVDSHGPFTWGSTPEEAVKNAKILEEISMMAWHTLTAKGMNTTLIQQALLDRHYLRKHGQDAYYGQPEKNN